jgi:hypothetical protein
MPDLQPRFHAFQDQADSNVTVQQDEGLTPRRVFCVFLQEKPRFRLPPAA